MSSSIAWGLLLFFFWRSRAGLWRYSTPVPPCLGCVGWEQKTRLGLFGRGGGSVWLCGALRRFLYSLLFLYYFVYLRETRPPYYPTQRRFRLLPPLFFPPDHLVLFEPGSFVSMSPTYSNPFFLCFLTFVLFCLDRTRGEWLLVLFLFFLRVNGNGEEAGQQTAGANK